MANLRTDYKDDVLDTSQNTNRVFDIKDAEGNVIYSNVSIEDVTAYLQEGSNFGAQNVNEQNQAINQLSSSLSAINNLAYSSSGLTAGGCSITHGGYAKLGNLVIVNIRFTVSAQSPYITGFPVPKAGTAGFAGYDGLNEKAAFGYLNDSGQLHIPNAYGSTGAINVSFSYLTN